MAFRNFRDRRMMKAEYAIYRILIFPLYLTPALVVHITLYDYSLLDVRQIYEVFCDHIFNLPHTVQQAIVLRFQPFHMLGESLLHRRGSAAVVDNALKVC